MTLSARLNRERHSGSLRLITLRVSIPVLSDDVVRFSYVRLVTYGSHALSGNIRRSREEATEKHGKEMVILIVENSQ